MNTRLTIMLAGVLTVLLAAVWYAGDNPSPAATPAAAGSGPTLLDAGAGDITEIVVERGGRQVTARRADGDSWTYSADGGAFAPADNQRIRSLTTRLAGLKAQSTVSEQPDAGALAEYGLDSPALHATVTAAGRATTLVVGSDNARRTGKYVRLGDTGPVYLAEAFLLDDLASLTTQLPAQPTPTATAAPTAAATPATTPTAAATGTPAP